MSIDYESYDEYYDNAEVKNEFEPIPDGIYQVFIDEIALTETQKDPKRPMLAWTLKIISGEFTGRLLFKNAVVSIDSTEATQRSLSFIKTDLSIAGAPACKFSEIPTYLPDLLNVQLEVKVVTKPLMKNGQQVIKDGKEQSIQNVWIQKKIEVSNSDDIPF